MRLYRNRGRALEAAGEYPAQGNYQEMLELGTARKDRALEVAALTGMCVIHPFIPVFNSKQAKKLGQTALELSRTLEDRAAEAGALWGMMLVELYSNNADGQRVLAYGEQSLAIARQLGLKGQVGNVLINLCWPYIAQKQLDAARQANLEAQDIWRALGNIPKLLETYDMQEFILSIASDHEGVLATATEALRLSRSTGNRSIQRRALIFTGDIRKIRGQFGLSLANMEAAMDLSKVDYPASRHSVYSRLQSLLLHAGALDQAERWADKLYALEKVSCRYSRLYFLPTSRV